MTNAIKKFIREEDGVAAIEYALLAGLIAVALITVLTNTTTAISGVFSRISTALGKVA